MQPWNIIRMGNNQRVRGGTRLVGVNSRDLSQDEPRKILYRVILSSHAQGRREININVRWRGEVVNVGGCIRNINHMHKQQPRNGEPFQSVPPQVTPELVLG